MLKMSLPTKTYQFARFFLVFFVLFTIWFLLVGVVRLDELIVGFVASLMVAIFTSNLMIYGSLKEKFNFKKWFYAEVKAHIDVIKRILHPKMPIKPGIVEVPYTMKTDCGIVCVANSITNTPGTVTVEVDGNKKCYYVHWIWVVSPQPEVCYKEIISGFEKYTRRFFG